MGRLTHSSQDSHFGGCPTHSWVSNVWETMDQLEATSLRLVLRQFTPTHSDVRNEWGTPRSNRSAACPRPERYLRMSVTKPCALRHRQAFQACASLCPVGLVVPLAPAPTSCVKAERRLLPLVP